MLWLDEVEGGIISRYAVLDGNPDEKAQVPRSLTPHRQQFGQPPTLLTGDWGLHSTANERYATTHGVTEVVLPKPGKKVGEAARVRTPSVVSRGAQLAGRH